MDDGDLQDGMENKWSPELVAEHVTKWCKQKETIEGPDGKINIIVTFDEDGVSGHLNHKAVFHGISHLMDKKMLSDIEVFTLASVALFRKYISLADVNFCFPDEWHAFQYDPFWAYRTLA